MDRLKFKELVSKISSFVFREFKQNFWLVIAILIFFISYMHKSYSIVYIGIGLIFLGINFMKQIKNEFGTLMGIFIVLYGIILALLKFDSGLAFTGLFIMLILIIVINNSFDIKKNFIIGPILTLFLCIIAVLMTFPLLSQFLDLIFKKEVYPQSLVLLLVIFIFIIFAFYSIIRYILFFCSKIPSLEKIDNKYLALSLMIILVICLIGLWGLRNFYINDYPFSFTVSNQSIVSGEIFNCNSMGGKVYFLNDDWVSCSANLSVLKNYTLQSQNTELRKRYEGNLWVLQNSTEVFFVQENNSIILARFRLDSNAKSYNFNIPFRDDQNNLDFVGSTFDLEALSKDEYNYKIRERLLFLLGAISLALFSVFSSVANLKKILEKED